MRSEIFICEVKLSLLAARRLLFLTCLLAASSLSLLRNFLATLWHTTHLPPCEESSLSFNCTEYFCFCAISFAKLCTCVYLQTFFHFQFDANKTYQQRYRSENNNGNHNMQKSYRNKKPRNYHGANDGINLIEHRPWFSRSNF